MQRLQIGKAGKRGDIADPAEFNRECFQCFQRSKRREVIYPAVAEAEPGQTSAIFNAGKVGNIFFEFAEGGEIG